MCCLKSSLLATPKPGTRLSKANGSLKFRVSRFWSQATQREAQWLISYDPLKGLLFLILLGVRGGLYPKICHTTIYHIPYHIYIYKYQPYTTYQNIYQTYPIPPPFSGNVFSWEVISTNPSSYKPHRTIGPRSCLGCCAWICPKPQQNGNGSSWHWNSWIFQLGFK